MKILPLTTNYLSGVNSSRGSLLGEVLVSTPREINLADPYYATIDLKVLDMVLG